MACNKWQNQRSSCCYGQNCQMEWEIRTKYNWVYDCCGVTQENDQWEEIHTNWCAEKTIFIENFNFSCNSMVCIFTCKILNRGRRDRNRMVVALTTIYAISVYHNWCCELESRSGRGVQHYGIQFVSDLLQVGEFILVLRFPPPKKLTAMI